MHYAVQRSNERGHANHRWLDSRFSFSFAEYRNPDRMGFGALRVINDDTIYPGGIFNMHPHRDMEIVTIVTQGAIAHEDSMGNRSVLRAGEIQHMSAGTGILHRIFKEEYGETLHATLQSIRLQKAASLLLTNHRSTVSEIASQCGYASHTAFIRAFKARFSLTPTAWRKGGYLEYARNIIAQSESASRSTRDFTDLSPEFALMPKRRVAYIRHKGYNRSIKASWQRLIAYAHQHGIASNAMQIGLHHDNPTITPLESCSYVACLEVENGFEGAGSISTMTIPESYCALFRCEGVYGDVLQMMHHIYHRWLPQSGFEAKTLPAYVIYEKNHFLNADGRFRILFALPVNVI